MISSDRFMVVAERRQGVAPVIRCRMPDLFSLVAREMRPLRRRHRKPTEYLTQARRKVHDAAQMDGRAGANIQQTESFRGIAQKKAAPARMPGGSWGSDRADRRTPGRIGCVR
ncbi:MAG TPA: hypothetical protein VMB76_15595 [Casimicrobiaceae bacterium]|nr:hypothetical protein [Casimicrobiaceae bacterium]